MKYDYTTGSDLSFVPFFYQSFLTLPIHIFKMQQPIIDQ